MDEIEREILAHVEQFGWHQQMVIGDQDQPPWEYTIGLFHSYGHPEFVIFGLPTELLSTLIRDLSERVQRGEQFADGQRSPVLLQNYDVAFRAVDRSHYPDYFGRAIDFYRGDAFPVLQCFWPDRDGRFPWDVGMGEPLRRVQPILAPL